jgi:hypothetical protein
MSGAKLRGEPTRPAETFESLVSDCRTIRERIDERLIRLLGRWPIPPNKHRER